MSETFTEPQVRVGGPSAAMPALTTTRRARLARRARRIVIGVIVAALLPLAWSYGHALGKPGSDSLGIRTTEWVKDHGGRGIVAWAERTWYQHHAPKKGGLPSAAELPTIAPSGAPPTTLQPYDVPTPPHLLVAQPLAGEGSWQPGPRSAGGAPLAYTTFVQPSATYSSLITGLAWLDPKRVRLELYSGTEQPGGGWNLMAPIPVSLRPQLIAGWNSGFKLSDSHGGYFAEGRQAPGHPLANGQASLVIFKDGTATVGAWGRDAQMGPNIEAVRQNLVLLVDNGQEASDLDHESLVRWGFTPGNKTFVWRSGVGVDAGGHLIYAAGQLTIHALADVLQAAGCLRAMELDINSTWVHFFTYHDEPGAAGATAGGRLLPAMSASTDEYFKPSSRDFFAAFAR